ncbi:MAG: S8 family serine peptidase [Actinomycetota bacterium]|nr:S8 family serine peptidase [Actinomycetota bacterium]
MRAPFSAGGRSLDLVAPGVGILQQTLDGVGGYADRSWSGTSMASPQVAGVAALALAAGRARTATGLARLLTRTALDLGVPGRDPAYGAGLVRADAALGVAVP